MAQYRITAVLAPALEQKFRAKIQIRGSVIIAYVAE